MELLFIRAKIWVCSSDFPSKVHRYVPVIPFTFTKPFFVSAFTFSRFPCGEYVLRFGVSVVPSSSGRVRPSGPTKQRHGARRARRGSAGGAPADRGQRLLQEGPPRRRHRLLHRGKHTPHLPSPRFTFIAPWGIDNTKQIDSINRASNSECSLSDESLLGNRALSRRPRLLDQSGLMPFQAQVSLLVLPLPSPPPLGPSWQGNWKSGAFFTGTGPRSKRIAGGLLHLITL